MTIRNTRITSTNFYPLLNDDNNPHTGLLIEDVEIAGVGVASGDNVTSGIAFTDYMARRVYIHGTIDGFKADNNVLIED